MNKPAMPSDKTCDFVWPSGRRCRKLAVDEPLVPMPVAGPHGVCEFLPGSRSAFLCAKHAKEFLRSRTSSISIGWR